MIFKGIRASIAKKPYIFLILQEWFQIPSPLPPSGSMFDVPIMCGLETPKMTWKNLTENNSHEWKMSAVRPHKRDIWRSGAD